MMHRFKPMISAMALLLAALPSWGEIIDRIVVIVDDKFIITLSDIRKARAVESALGEDPGSDDAIANLLVDKHVVEEQIARFRTIEIPDSDIAERLRTLKAPPGVSDQEMREAVRAKLRRSAFMNQRFGQFIRVSDEEVADYYQKTLVPELRLRGEPIPTLEIVRDTIRQNVILERMSDEFNAWLAELLNRTTIEKIPY